MRYFLQIILTACVAIGALFALSAAADMRTAVQEIELQIGVLIVAVSVGALLMAGAGTKKSG